MVYVIKLNDLINEQLSNWDFAKNGYDSIKNVSTKTFIFEKSSMLVQNNPKRIISSSAKVDEKSINERPCFLCKNNLPKEQKALEILDKYLLLINPFPIFPLHLTIPTFEHIPQLIENSIGDMLDISKILEDYIIFYNGPQCGASAPDHMHFQAGSRGFLPIEKELRNITSKENVIFCNEASNIFAFNDNLRKIIVIESHLKDSIIFYFQKIYSILKKDLDNEPLLNILCIFDREKWKLIIFPRKKHRPFQFFEEGEEKLLLSPASVDFGGVCILPRIEDFNKITKEIIIDVFNQLTIDDLEFDNLIKLIQDM